MPSKTKRPGHFELHQALKRLRGLKNPSQIKHTLNKVTHSFKHQGYSMHLGQQMFRVVNQKDRGEEALKDFGYPPPEFASEGRCNSQGVQAFYASNSKSCCIDENKNMDVGDQFRLGVWETTRVIWYVDFTARQINLDARSRKLINEFSKIYKNPGDEFHPISSRISELVFGAKSSNGAGVDFPGFDAVLYPSTLDFVKGPQPMNLAFRKSALDSGLLRLVECFHCEILGKTDEHYDIGYRYAGKPETNAPDSAIQWTTTGKVLIPPKGSVELKVHSDGSALPIGGDYMIQPEEFRIER